MSPIARAIRREVDTMTVLALITAILELAASIITLVVEIKERLPVREDEEPN